MLKDKLREIRESKGYKQQDLANLLKVSIKVVAGWEAGVSEPPVLSLPAIAKFYGCKIDDFFEEEMTESKEELEERLEELEERLDELLTEESNIEEEIYEIEKKLEGYKQTEEKEKTCLEAQPVYWNLSTDVFEAFCELAKDGIVKNEKEITKLLEDNEELKPNLESLFTLVGQSGGASISLFQRRLSIGYCKAGVLIDGLEKIGVITGFDGAKARKIIQDNFNAFKEYLGIE